MDRDFVPPSEVLRARKRMNDAVRQFFDGRGFLEVETPIAVVSPGLEPHLEAFETVERGPEGRSQPLYLHTSPEYAMKRLLGRGTGPIYQLARVFRNGERSHTHAPEFTMLEWYRKPGTLQFLANDVEDLVEEVAQAVHGPWRPQSARRLTISEAFVGAGLGDPLHHLGDLEGLQAALQIPAVPGDDWDAVFFRAFFEHVEAGLTTDRVTFLFGYPASMAALARLDPADPRRADRFEAFVGPLEIANAFGELSDREEQRRRFMADLDLRRRMGRQLPPIDEGLLQDLPGLGDDTAGIALGLDRLLMTCLGLTRIQDVLPFSPRD